MTILEQIDEYFVGRVTFPTFNYLSVILRYCVIAQA